MMKFTSLSQVTPMRGSSPSQGLSEGLQVAVGEVDIEHLPPEVKTLRSGRKFVQDPLIRHKHQGRAIIGETVGKALKSQNQGHFLDT